MKKASMCIVALCLTAQDISASRPVRGINFDLLPEEEARQIQEHSGSAEKLRPQIVKFFGDVSPKGDIAVQFKRKFNVRDDVMQTALMSIVNEYSEKAEWGTGEWTSESSIAYAKARVTYAIEWLGACADSETKRFLLDIATDNAKNIAYRRAAIGSYLRRADAQEVRDVLGRFLVGDMRMENPYATYRYAMIVYDETDENEQKRKAIIAMLSDALAKEENKGVFAYADKQLVERSREYAESPQRKAAQERFNTLLEKDTQ